MRDLVFSCNSCNFITQNLFERDFMERQPQLLVYKASAGSGKTFTLAVQYIRQLIEDPTAYRRILAVTFTNKATTEMKERILSQLYGIATNDKSSEGYLREIKKYTSQPENVIRQKADEALHNLIHDYSRFRVETIDSFFQSVMRNLARELELNANLNVELDITNTLSDAVDAMIEKLHRDSPVMLSLLDYIEERIEEAKKWNVSKDIKKFGKNIFDEVYIEKGTNLRAKLNNPQFIPSYRKEVKEIQTGIQEQMKGFNEHFLEILNVNGLQPNDLYNGVRGMGSYFKKLADGDLSDKVRNKTVEKSLTDPESWATKTSKARDLIIQLAQTELIPLLENAEKLRGTNKILMNSCKLSLHHINNLRLLTSIDQEVREQNSEHNRFLLSDTNALLHSLIQEGDASFVYEKIGTNIDVVMIDEFQDTSRMQWENFHILLEESMSQKEGSMIVGDIKQSIYRWRNGDWKILAGLDKDPSFSIDTRTLDTNWRSEANIIHFNNEVFTAACKVLNNRHEEELNIPCTELLNAYSDVCQKTSKTNQNGYVKVTFLKNQKAAEYQEATFRELAKEIDTLIEQGVQLNDIAILVRFNKFIPWIAAYFHEHTPYHIVSNEAFRLDASLAVNMLIDCLRYLAVPEDNISCAQLAHAFQTEILHKDISLNTILMDKVEDYLPAAFRLQIEELRFMPLYELLEKIYVLFDMKELKEQDAYLCAFFDTVTNYLLNNSSDLTAFLNKWDDSLFKTTIPSGEISGIRILSIHQSKGLEYHTVVIPFCDWPIEKNRNEVLVWSSVSEDQKDLEPFNKLDLVPIAYDKSMADSVYHDDYVKEHLQLWVDNLNLLYVAFTRASKNLIIIGQDSSSDTVSGVLQDALGNMENLEMKTLVKPSEKEEDEGAKKSSKRKTDKKGTDEESVQHESAAATTNSTSTDSVQEDPAQTDEDQVESAYEYGTLCPSKAKKVEVSTNRLLTEPTPIPVHLESIESEIEFKQSNRSADFIRGDEEEEKQEQYIHQGQLLHRLFASIYTEDDLPQAIEQLKFEGVLESAKQEEQLRKLADRALSNPEVKDWYNGSWKLYNECSIIYPDEEGNLQTRRPDRVMMKGNKVVVVDFKFGKPRPEYIDQVNEYVQLLTTMGYQHISGYLWYVYANKLEEVKQK